jgi:recombination protein RecT
MSTAIARKSEFADLKMQLEQRSDQFSAALPKHIPAERFMRVVLTAVQFTPELLECTKVSLFNAALKSAQDGLLPDGREAAMVVRKNFRAGTKEVSYQPMIAGIRKKARNSGDIASWDAHVVCQNDHFQFQLGDNPQVNHSYDLKLERGPMIGAYSVAVMKDGSKSYEVMSITDINRIRDQSDGWKSFSAGKIKSTPWSTAPEEMARKTVARRHAKALPMSSDLDDLVRRDDELYDFKGARESQEAIEPRPRDLTSRMDALAAPRQQDATPHDPVTGEIQAEAVSDTDGEFDETEHPAGGVPQGSGDAKAPPGSRDGAGSPPSASASGGEPSEADREAAFQAGVTARANGLSLRKMPDQYRDNDALADAWERGHGAVDTDEDGGAS